MSESTPVVRAIVAMASNRVIGRDGQLPWRLPEDLKWFKKLTIGNPVVMGRKTMDSIGRPLPKRRNVVISRSLNEAPQGFELVKSCDQAIDHLKAEPVINVIGGAEIYREMLPMCSEVYLSYVFEAHEGDTQLIEFEQDFKLLESIYRDDDFELRRYVRG